MVAGVDLGGTSAKIGIVDRAGAILARDRVPIDARAGFEDIVGPIAAALAALLRRGRGGRPAGIGIGAPGFIDPTPARSSAAARTSPPCWADRPPRTSPSGSAPPPGRTTTPRAPRPPSSRSGRVGDSAASSSSPSARASAAASCSGGRCGGACADSPARSGTCRSIPEGPPCPCGSRGCLEQYASGPAIVRAWKAGAGPRAGEADSPAEVARLARAGDPGRARGVRGAGRALGQAAGRRGQPARHRGLRPRRRRGGRGRGAARARAPRVSGGSPTRSSPRVSA